MSVRILHCSDIENATDDSRRVGRLACCLRERHDDRTLVCDAGDTIASDLLSMETSGEHADRFYEAVDPDFATFGNHDFDNGVAALRDVVALR